MDTTLIASQMQNLPAGTPIVVRWLFGDEAYGREDATYTATLNCVDFIGTATFTRHEDGFIGVAGAGAWSVA